MKKAVFLLLLMGLFFMDVPSMNAQEKPHKSAKEKAEAAKAPALYDYQPGLLASGAARRAEIERIRVLIDSMDIPASRRFKLVRDL